MGAFLNKVRSKLTRRFWIGISIALCGLIVMRVAFGFALSWIPLPEGIFEPPRPAVEFVDRQGQSLRETETPESLGILSTLESVPPALIDATLAAEDRRFWRHHGVDWRATARAAWEWAKNGRVVSGGSTLTQQLVKSFQKRPRTVRAKMNEALQALRLEQIWSKERILIAYLNRLDYGNRCRGPASAARYYFDVPIQELSKAQAAFLAGLPQAPSRLNPRRHFAQAKKRQVWILDRMGACGFLAKAERERALGESIRLAAPGRAFNAPHFVDLILQQHGEVLETMSGKVSTTLNLELNRVAESILREQLRRLKDHHVQNGAIVVIDNQEGDVLALVGSENYFAPGDGQVNGAWAPRSAGSAFKPFTYAIAFEKGATPGTVVADVPSEFATPTGVFAPVNYRRLCHGPMRYRNALANSLNIPAVKVLDSIGGPAILQNRLRACGLTTLNDAPDHYGLGLTIGNAGARLIELANAYACLARLGIWKPYRLIREPNQAARQPMASRVFEGDAAFLIADILSDNNARALEFGMNSALRFDFPVACKTGTSTDFRDNWAMGYTPEFTVGVWVGNFDGSPMEQVSGVTGAAPILHEMFVELRRRFGMSWYPTPANIVERRIHPITGKMLADQNSGGPLEKFTARFVPEHESAEDYDRRGRVRLSEEYRDWFASGKNWLADQAVIDANAPFQSRARIVSPLPGTIYFLDADLPNQGRRLNLRAEGLGDPQWQSDTLPISTGSRGVFARLEPGRHELTAADRHTGNSVRTWIEVKNR